MEIKIQSLDQIHEAARQFKAEMGENTVFDLYGKMGACNTTFIKAVSEELLPGKTINVTIEEVENGEREVTLESFE